MQVVRGVDGKTLTVFGGLVGLPRTLVRADSVTPTSDLIVRVGGHVVDVARAGDGSTEEVSTGLALVRLGRGLRGVYVEVARARMSDVPG